MSLTKKDFLRMLADSAGDDEEQKSPPRDKPTQARVLRDILPDILAPNTFQVGDLVEQKPNVGIYNWPAEGCLAIVTQLIADQPRNGKRWERDDMVIMCDAEGKWVEFSAESWRFRKYEGAVE